MSDSPVVVKNVNLSHAWREALVEILKTKEKEITPLLISLTDFTEDIKIREVIEAKLKQKKKATIDTVADTIFPDALYHLYDQNRFDLYKEYKEILPRLKKIESKKNGRGTYFERLIDFDGKENNQLENIITSLQIKGGVRRSKLQASIFDPARDHLDVPYQGFPCLQHVTFFPTKTGGLVLNSFYAVQYLFERAYGNWLGLINLGKFVANEAGLKFERFNCFIGIEQLDKLKKTDTDDILKLTA